MSKRNPVTYHEVFKYLSNKTERYPEGCSDARKRAIRKFSDKILLEDGVLFYVQSDSEEKQNAKGKRQWIADKEMQQQILQSMHDDPAGAGADAGLLSGEGILQGLHNAHAQPIDHAHFRHFTMANNNTKAKKSWLFHQKSLK